MDARPPAPAEPDPVPEDEPPPILGSWRTLYALVIVELLLVIALCGWLSTRGR